MKQNFSATQLKLLEATSKKLKCERYTWETVKALGKPNQSITISRRSIFSVHVLYWVNTRANLWKNWTSVGP